MRRAIGFMTGTSIDGIDAAMIEVEGAGIEIRVRLLKHASAPLHDLAERLWAFADGASMTAEQIAVLATEFGVRHEQIGNALIEAIGHRPDIAALHGQTVYHKPPISWQLINPWPVAEQMGCPLVYVLRGADLSAGGQGAPITPIADWVLFRSHETDRVIVNLGGFCNITVLPRACSPSSVEGRDVCACNQVLDRVCRAATGRPYDDGGDTALGGRVNESASDALFEALARQTASARSLGTGDEETLWISSWSGSLDAEGLLASAVDGVARAIVAGLGGHAGDVLLGGGGVKNIALVRAIDRHLGRATTTTASVGIPVHAREAVAIAVLGVLALDGVDITLPAATGRDTVCIPSGAWIGRH